jgi:oligopeptide/dipeptide ABC transporter ATP-binding protein
MRETQPVGEPSAPVLAVTGLCKTYHQPGRGLRARGHSVRAVDGVSFQVRAGETLAIVGESGSGKSTVGRCLLRLTEPSAGEIELEGRPLTALPKRELRALRPRMQMVFQDPYSAIDPRQTVHGFVSEPLHIHKWSRDSIDPRVEEVLTSVGLDGAVESRYPHELSGGQRQRVVIARALALRPSLLVLDEPVAALDVSIQAGIMRLLSRLQTETRLAYVFISHDLAVVNQIADRVAVMHRGRIVEHGTTEQVYSSPSHPFTQALLSAAPIPDPRAQRSRTRIVLGGDQTESDASGTGCTFRHRCWKAREECTSVTPELLPMLSGSAAACHFPVEQDDFTQDTA